MTEQYCWGRLQRNRWQGLEFVIDSRCRPYDVRQGDRIASVEYDDVEAAIQELGRDSVAMAIETGDAPTSGYVSYNGREL